MSDPMGTRPEAVPPTDPSPGGPPPRKGASPLIWILVLIALIAFAWYFYNRNSARETVAELTPAPATTDALTPADSVPADARRPAASKPAKRAKPIAKARIVNRDASLLEQPRPSYPPEAFRAREQGTVVVLASIDATGKVQAVKIAKRSGSRILDRAAMNEVRGWKFKPAMKGGKTVASNIQVPVDYKLDAQ